jgi:hypothetical protein
MIWVLGSGFWIVGRNEGGRGRKQTFSRGNLVSIPGNESNTPAGVDTIGQVLSNWFRSACAPSRAVAARSASRFSELLSWSGLGSKAQRRPRSKV